MNPTLRVLIGILSACIFSACNPPGGETPTSGLDTRPANAECVAFPLAGNAGAKVTPAFTAINLGSPVTGIYQPPGDNSRWYVTAKSGVLATFANNDDVSAYNAVSNLPTINDDGEGGLLSMAFHPLFALNRQVFLSYTTSTTEHSMVSRVTRYTLTTDHRLTNPTEFIELVQPAINHNGGNITFGPDGYLYIGFGDGGGAEDEFGNGQNLTTLHSKMLRINVDVADTVRGKPYSIPSGNMLSAAAGFQREIYAHGFRNPWKFSFDRNTGDLWVADVGQYRWEEVNRVEAGKNHGWPVTEGNHCFGATSCSTAGLTAPVFEYDHSEGCAITGGFVYRGSAIPALAGRYIYGDYCANGVSSFAINSPMETKVQLTTSPGGITAFGEANDGEIYVGTDNGSLYRLEADATIAESVVPQTLSTHPCFEDAASQQLVSGAIPYSVNSALWSDGADKTRFIAVPDDRKIGVVAKGDMSFPVGSVLIKQFYHANRLIETRFLMHHDTGWAGYSYEWNDEGTDAVLSNDAHNKVIDASYTHIFPSPAQCFQCHTTVANTALGLETAQLNRLHTYEQTSISANQLDTWQHIGLFTTPLTTSNRNRVMPSISDTAADSGTRARAYLHSNCSGCHRPGGFPSHIDLRYDTTLAKTGLCNVDPLNGDLGITGAKLLTPGNPAASLLYLRLSRNDEHRMPPLARDTPDTAALGVIEHWINSLAGCP